MAIFVRFQRVCRAVGWTLRQATDRSRRSVAYGGRRRRAMYLPEGLEPRILLSAMTLSGTSGADVIVFQQTDATHDTFTLNGTQNTFSTAGITSITIDSLSGNDSITVLSNNAGIPLTVMGSGMDTVNVGNSGSLQGILGTVTLSGTTGQMTLTVSDSADSTLLNSTISSTSISGLAPADIDYTSGQLGSITIKGGNGGDSIHLNTFNVTSTAAGTPVTVNGTGNYNNLVGPNIDDTWNLTGSSEGTGTVGNISFANIQNLTGGTGNDRFVFMPNVVVEGSVNGGGGTDTLDYSSRSVGVVVNLQTKSATAIAGGFANINSLVGSTDSNTLTGANTTNTWNLTGVNSGMLNGTFAFSGIENLTGGTANDTFAFMNGGNVSGQIRGGGGTDTLDYSALSTGVNIDLSNGLATDTSGVSAIKNVVSSTGNNTIIANPLGSVITASGSGSNTLHGGGGNDTFILSATQGAGTTIAGNGGSNTIIGPSVTNTWTITSGNSGTVNGASFTNIQNLTGGTGNDKFVFTPNGFVSGTVNGGGGTDTLDYSSRSVGVVVNLQANSATAIGGGISNISSIIGSNDSDTLVGANSANVWNITGLNAGTVNGSLTFTGIENLTGGTVNDTFAFKSGGSISGQIRGGGGVDTLDYSALSLGVIVDLSNGVAPDTGGVSAIQNVTGSTGNDTITAATSGSVINGNGGNDTLIGGPSNDTFVLGATQGTGTIVTGRGGSNMLVGANFANTWNITGGNSGTLNGVAFEGIQNLTGGTASDTFAFIPSGFVSGAVNGGGGNDILDYSSRSVGVVVSLQGNFATAIGGGISNISLLIGSTDSDVLIGANTTNTWNITGWNSGTLNGAMAFSGVENLTGGIANDTFAFANGGNISGLVRGGGGIDTLDYSGLSSGVTIDLSNGVAADTGGVSAIQNVIGSTGDDTITAATGGSVISGGGGNDRLNGGPGNDTFVFSASQGGTVVNGGAGINTLVGANINNFWDIYPLNSGLLNGAPFNNIQNLVGGTSRDTFQIAPSGFVSGTVNGGGGGNDAIDYSSRNVGVVVNLQTNSATAIGGGFTNINSLIGSSDSDTLIGANTTNTWNVAGVNSGTVNGTFTFSGIENLTGGAGNDAFAFASGGSISGQIGGGDGINTLDYSAIGTGIVVDLSNRIATDTGGVYAIQNVIGTTGNDTITAAAVGTVVTGNGGNDTLIGGPGNDTFILSAAQGSGTTVTGSGGSNTLVGANIANAWNITSGNSGTLNGVAFNNIQNLTGGTANDSYAFKPNGFVAGTVNGGGGTDTLDYSGRSAGVVVNLQTNSATAIGGGVTNVQNVFASQGGLDSITAGLTGSVITSYGGGETLIGGPGTDTFIFSNNPWLGSTVNGMGGNDTLIGPNITSTWNITGKDSGAVNLSGIDGITYTNIPNLIGGTGLNNFHMGVNGSVTGRLNGGSPTGDWLDYSAWNVNKSYVNLAAGTATKIGTLVNIQNVRAAQYGGLLTGDSLGNILIGGVNSDTMLQGGSGRSLLLTNDPTNGVPDQFPSALNGGSGNDIIVGKSTTYDASTLANDMALASILVEWQSADSYATRIAYINGTTPGGLNGTNYLIFGTTVIPSPGATTMTGAAGGMNWYFAGVHDRITNLQPGEQVN